MKHNQSTVFWLYLWVKKYFFWLVLLIITGSMLSLSRVFMAVLTKKLIDGAVEGVWEQAVNACLSFAVVIILQIFLKGVTTLLSVNTLENMSNQMRNKLFLHLLNIRWIDYSVYHSGDLMTRMTSDVTITSGGLVSAIPEIISLSIGLIAAVTALFIYDPILAVYALFLGPAALAAGYVFGRRFMNIHEKSQEAESNYRAYIQESLIHLLIVKTFCLNEKAAKKMDRLLNTKKRLVLKKSLAAQITSTFVTGGFWLCYLLVFVWGAYKLYKGLITFGTLMVFIQLVGQVQSPFMELAGALPRVMSTFSSAKRLNELEKVPCEKKYETQVFNNFVSIQLDGIHFSYKEGRPVLQDLSLQIRMGEMLGLMGASGEGKTTLIHILMQLLEPQMGKILIHDSKEFLQTEGSLRTLIAYVPQGNTLFSGSIADNLKIGSSEASEEEMFQALKAADAIEFVSELKDGIHTFIGEGGVGLSEGQAQRIAIARALIRNAPILIFDEATSALDAETEERVLLAITLQEKGRTCIFISHRPILFHYCDRVLQLKKGRLYEISANRNTYINEA